MEINEHFFFYLSKLISIDRAKKFECVMKSCNIIIELATYPRECHVHAQVLCLRMYRYRVYACTGIVFTHAQVPCLRMRRYRVYACTGTVFTHAQVPCLRMRRYRVYACTGIVFTHAQVSCLRMHRYRVFHSHLKRGNNKNVYDEKVAMISKFIYYAHYRKNVHNYLRCV